ncbi:universal stress protein [Streptomyces sp. TRM68367]|uniref:universal stress protein n=1 Tax=Streptomyces sp. TRM68367 TaxID=2758415 RepID=UPI00165C0A18|nr:universal stress protein [Streptomyces sp. TRM68367]MBC9727648.1 universal stress protein [Streptomyces sp. TRM68367]
MTSAGPAGTVLVGVDDTSHTWLAAEWAATEAELRGAPLRILHAVGPDTGAGADEPGAAETVERIAAAGTGVLDDARDRIAAAHPRLRVDTVLARDDPAEALLTAAEDTGLVVVGTRGRGGFAGLLLGSVSLKVAAHADRPVVVARGHTERAAEGHVVVGVRDERDEAAVRFALAEAGRRRTAVRLVHAWAPVVRAGVMVPQASRLDEEQRLHARLLNEAARPVAEYPQVHADTELVVGPAAAALVDASARAGLVVLPRHPPAGRFGLRLGSVVHAVLHHADCPVAVVPTE